MRDHQYKAYNRIFDLIKGGQPRVMIKAQQGVGSHDVIESIVQSPDIGSIALKGEDRPMDVLCLGSIPFMGKVFAKGLEGDGRNVVTAATTRSMNFKGESISGKYDLIVFNQCPYPNAMKALKTYKSEGLIDDETVVLMLMHEYSSDCQDLKDAIEVMPLGDIDLQWMGVITPEQAIRG